MLDINFIREHHGAIKRAIKEKKVAMDLDELLQLDSKRRSCIQKLDELNRERRAHATRVKQGSGAPDRMRIAQGRSIKERISATESELKRVETRFRELMLLVPNVYPEDTPVGSDETGNREIRRWGDIPQFTFKALDHVTLGRQLNIIDIERGVKVSGFRGYYLKNEGAQLQWALMTYCIDTMVSKGFTFFIPPTLVREVALIGSGHFPEARQEVYAADDRFLIGTAEPSLLAYRANEMLNLDELPLKYCAVSPCFRKEIGSYGKDTRGLYRLHEFWKVEQVIVCKNDLEMSLQHFEEMLAISEEILQALQLPYRVVRMCTGDMGAGKYKMYDVETWMSSRNAYGETHSCSHLTDWQARRLHIRYKDEHGTTVFPHTMNNTVIASPRILIAILENYQTSNGCVQIPKVLQPLMHRKKRISP